MRHTLEGMGTEWLRVAGAAALLFCWGYFWFGLGWLYFSIARRRRRSGEDSLPRRTNHSARLGILLEAVSIALLFSGHRPMDQAPWWSLAAGLILLPASVAGMHASLRTLGVHWRIQAVVTESHQLVRHGPYAYLRHPVYAALLGMVIGTGLIWSSPAALGWAVVVCTAGTEIRVRAEDSLLQERFGEEFEAYRSAVKAYLPWVR